MTSGAAGAAGLYAIGAKVVGACDCGLEELGGPGNETFIAAGGEVRDVLVPPCWYDRSEIATFSNC